MDTQLLEQLRPVWQQVSQRNGWRLIADEAAFLETVTRTCRLVPEVLDAAALRILITRAYCRRLYIGIAERHELAAGDLWRIAFHAALRRGLDREAAGEIAQAAVQRALEQLDRLRDPAALIAWVDMIVLDLLSRQRRREQRLVQLEQAAPALPEPVDPYDIAEVVEERAVMLEVARLLRRALPQRQHVLVILLAVVQGLPTVAVARLLGKTSADVRNIKSRALKTLRQRPEMLARLRELLLDY